MKPNLNLNHSLTKPYLEKEYYYFNILPKLKNIIVEIGESLDESYIQKEKYVWIHKTASIDFTTKLIGPLIIGRNSILRFSSFIRGNVIIGDNVVIGNSVEIKNSIIGYSSHIGAGTILSNCRLDKKKIKVNNISTNLNKLGSILGENVEIGCSSVLNPGTIIFENTRIPPLSNIKGIVKEKERCVE